jgi:hypothetical protein
VSLAQADGIAPFVYFSQVQYDGIPEAGESERGKPGR